MKKVFMFSQIPLAPGRNRDRLVVEMNPCTVVSFERLEQTAGGFLARVPDSRFFIARIGHWQARAAVDRVLRTCRFNSYPVHFRPRRKIGKSACLRSRTLEVRLLPWVLLEDVSTTGRLYHSRKVARLIPDEGSTPSASAYARLGKLAKPLDSKSGASRFDSEDGHGKQADIGLLHRTANAARPQSGVSSTLTLSARSGSKVEMHRIANAEIVSSILTRTSQSPPTLPARDAQGGYSSAAWKDTHGLHRQDIACKSRLVTAVPVELALADKGRINKGLAIAVGYGIPVTSITSNTASRYSSPARRFSSSFSPPALSPEQG